jgi:3'(2'), 5'-bisphosphate nucleotidase
LSAPFERERSVAFRAVREASGICREVSPRGIEKDDGTPVTIADLASQALICAALKEAFPKDPVVAEEDATLLRSSSMQMVRSQVVDLVTRRRPDVDSREVLRWIDRGQGEPSADRFWTVDPIDGTKGFLRGDQYAVALALVMDGEVEVAVLGCPNLPFRWATGEEAGVVLLGVRGRGTMAVPLGESSTGMILRVSDQEDPAEMRLCESWESRRGAHEINARLSEVLGLAAPPVRMDSQAKYVLLARGDAEIYIRPETPPGYREKIWDHAAGMRIVTEAGGRVTDLEGKPLDFTRGERMADNRGILATSGPLHDRALEAIRSIGLV